MYSKTTNGIQVDVTPTYLEEQSSPEKNQYLWAYQVRIENHSSFPVRLINRLWKITDANGQVQKIYGPGVVGEKPHLYPGESFFYTSGTPLTTPSGFMDGLYEMEIAESGEIFNVIIPAFSLDSPYDYNQQIH